MIFFHNKMTTTPCFTEGVVEDLEKDIMKKMYGISFYLTEVPTKKNQSSNMYIIPDYIPFKLPNFAKGMWWSFCFG